MYVIEVIPLIRGSHVESLTYYSGVSYKTGTLLTVPVRARTITAVVVGIKPVSVAKTALRTATFSLKKLPEQPDAIILPSSLIATVEKLAETTPAHMGSILFALLPPDVRTGVRDYPLTTKHQNEEETTPAVLTGVTEDRYMSYRSRIRGAFAHRGSVLFVVPTGASVLKAKERLSQGISERVITFSSIHTKRQIEIAYEAFADLSNAKLIITTPNYAFLDRHDITTIIVDESGSQHYTARTRPYLDARVALKTYAKVTGRSILLGDIVPRTEDEIQRRSEHYTTLDEHPKRVEFASKLSVLEHGKKEDGAEFSIFTPECKETIARTLSARGKVFLYSARKGIAPFVTCYDCGHVFRCPDSGAPYSLMRTMEGDEEKRWFLSSTSGKRVRAADTCTECGSWRLREQGVGIQHVYAEAKEAFPDATIILFDHTTAGTYQKARRLVTEFYETKNVILLGTAMVLPYLSKPFDLCCVTSYEATRAVPTWRADETILSLLLSLREKAQQECIVQTRSDPDSLLKIAQRGAIDQFYDEEIAIREALSYPPFSKFILLTWIGTKEQVNKLEAELEKSIVPYNMHTYSAPYSLPNKTTRYGLMRISAEDFPDPDLITILRNIPASVKIEMDPDKIV